MQSLLNLYFRPNTVSLIKPKKMRWARHVAQMGKLKIQA
jgi:hypothetical protein